MSQTNSNPPVYTNGTSAITQPDVMTDIVTPLFKKRSVNGEVIISPMSQYKATNVSTGQFDWAEFRDPTGGTYFARSTRTANYPTPEVMVKYPSLAAKVESCEALAITSAYAKVGAPDVSTLTELAELRETISFLWSPVKAMKAATERLSSYLKRFSRYEADYNRRMEAWYLRQAKRPGRSPGPKPLWSPPKMKWGKWSVDDVASAWLAYRYAIMPLIYLFQDIQKHLGRNGEPTRDTARAKADDSYSTTVRFGPFDTFVNGVVGAYKSARDETITARVVSRAGVLYVPDWSLSRQLGVQINRVPMALYESIPLSFVTDWFHNGAEVYDALTAEFRALRILGAWVTTVVTFDYSVSAGGVSTSDSRVTFGGLVTKTVGSGTWKRRRPASVSDVRLKLRVEIGAKRIGDALALIKVMLLTSRKP